MKTPKPMMFAVLTAATLGLGACGGGSTPTLSAGECMETPTVAFGSTEFPIVDCTEPHQAQVFHTFDLPDGAYPSNDQIVAAIEAECVPAFEEFVGLPYAESELFIRDLSPAEEGWENGDRQAVCIAYVEEGEVTESFEGSEL